ncbi:MAG: transposase [Motiliproteus sp.]
MARLPRLSLPGVPQHVVQRGNNRHACFFSDQDYPLYLDWLQHYANTYQVKIHAYVLMTNHVHLLLTPLDTDAVSRMMQALGRCYVRYVNTTYRRTGTLWEGRFRSTLVDSERYFLVVSCYIELNPVRAAMVEHPAEYPWSSYRSNALGDSSDLLTPHSCYTGLGAAPELRQSHYRGLFDQIIAERTLLHIQQATDKAWVLGDQRFIDQVEAQTGRRARPCSNGGDRRSERFWKNQRL